MTLVLVLLGGAIGAPTRYLTDVAVQRLHRTSFPWGTWAVNMGGSFVLGVVAAGASTWVETVVGTGFCGALTTFSTFGYETVRLAEEGEATTAAANVLGSLAVGLVAAALGWWIGGVVGV
jgi:CrcB protein